MISKIEIAGFKTLRQVTIPLSPGITVMVGANNSGKSNAIQAIGLLGEAIRQRNLQQAVQAQGAFTPRGQAPPPLSFFVTFQELCYRIRAAGLEELELKVGTAPYHLTFNNNRLMVPAPPNPRLPGQVQTQVMNLVAPVGAGLQQWATFPQSATADVKALEAALSGVVLIDFSVPSLRRGSPLQKGAALQRDGNLLPAVLDGLLGEQRDLFDAIEKDVKSAAKEVKRLMITTTDGPLKMLGVEEVGGSKFSAPEMSDGLLLLIALSTASHLPDGRPGPPGLLAIEEPERGIHPRRIRDVVDQLRRTAEKGTQVLLTTHSPLVLDEFRDHPESVLIFERDLSGTKVTRLSDKPEWKDLTKGGALGDIWYSGVLGGVP